MIIISDSNKKELRCDKVMCVQNKTIKLISIKYCPKRGHFFQGDLDIFHSAIRRIKNKPYNVVVENQGVVSLLDVVGSGTLLKVCTS